MDEVFIRIQGVQRYLWRAVDQDGVVLDILVQERRDATAAKRFFRRLLKGLQYVPRVIVTDKLRSLYADALCQAISVFPFVRSKCGACVTGIGAHVEQGSPVTPYIRSGFVADNQKLLQQGAPGGAALSTGRAAGAA